MAHAGKSLEKISHHNSALTAFNYEYNCEKIAIFNKRKFSNLCRNENWSEMI